MSRNTYKTHGNARYKLGKSAEYQINIEYMYENYEFWGV